MEKQLRFREGNLMYRYTEHKELKLATKSIVYDIEEKETTTKDVMVELPTLSEFKDRLIEALEEQKVKVLEIIKGSVATEYGLKKVMSESKYQELLNYYDHVVAFVRKDVMDFDIFLRDYYRVFYDNFGELCPSFSCETDKLDHDIRCAVLDLVLNYKQPLEKYLTIKDIIDISSDFVELKESDGDTAKSTGFMPHYELCLNWLDTQNRLVKGCGFCGEIKESNAIKKPTLSFSYNSFPFNTCGEYIYPMLPYIVCYKPSF